MKHYRVAGHCFGIGGNVPELPNLAPFEADGTGGPSLFSLVVAKDLPPVSGAPFFTIDDGPGFPETAIETLPDGFLFQTHPLPGRPAAGELRTTPDFAQARLLLSGEDDVFAVNNALMLLFALTSARRGLLEMHASAVISGGKGYLFLGKSGTGKSTHSRLWLDHVPGTELLNDDNPILRLMPDGSARVYGSPWSGKTPCYRNADAPVGAVVRLCQAPVNRMERLSALGAYASLMASASSFRPFEELAGHWHRTLEGLAATVPCYTLECRPDPEAAQLCYRTVHG